MCSTVIGLLMCDGTVEVIVHRLILLWLLAWM